MQGEAGDDRLSGGNGADILSGGDDDDVVSGGAGSDSLLGGAGNDQLDGTGGDASNAGATDTLDGGAGIDSLDYGTNALVVPTGGANLTATGGSDIYGGTVQLSSIEYVSGNFLGDTIDFSNYDTAGGVGATLAGFEGDDSLTGSAIGDSLAGDGGDTAGAGADTIEGGAGDDTIVGGGGNDSIGGGEGADSIDAGTGNDYVRWLLGGGVDSLDGAGGTDSLDIIGAGWTTVDGGNGFTQYNITGTQQFFFARNFETTLCFALGTLIATPRGPVPVEALRAGDPVLTRHGPGIKRVRWIGEQAFDARFIAPDRAPVRIRAGALGNGLPGRDLVVSPAHAVLVDGVLVDARLLVNGDGIVQERVAGTIAYRHIDLGEHDCVLAEGAWAESYRETGDRRAFHNAASAVERDVEPPCLPHVSAPEDLRLPALRGRLRLVGLLARRA